ncbi:MAG: acyloxyacyl hydrolase, partial [Bacteroidales bacterium]
MNIRLKYILFHLRFSSIMLVFVLLSFRGFSQDKYKIFKSNMMIEGKLHYGFLYTQNLELGIFSAHFPAFEISILQKTYGKHKWERAYNYPIIGITFFYSGMGNNQWLGSVYALMPNINFPLYQHKNLAVGFRIALGIGYVTKPFDRITNYKNLAIGSNLNAAVNLMFEVRYRLNNYTTLSTGISLQHFSNGSLKLPNYGLTAPLINVGAALSPFREKKPVEDRFYAPTSPYEIIDRRKMEFNLGGLLGYKSMKAVYGQNFIVYHLFETTFVQVSRKSKIGIGIDFSYDPSQLKKLELQGDTVSDKLK